MHIREQDLHFWKSQREKDAGINVKWFIAGSDRTRNVPWTNVIDIIERLGLNERIMELDM